MRSNLDAEMRAFIEQYIDSFLAWDLLVFFFSNPQVVETVAGLALRLGRKAQDVKVAVLLLAEKGIVTIASIDPETFCYSPSEEQKKLIERFITQTADQIFRLQVLSIVMEKVKAY
jgi:hypothetical protein